MLVTAPLVDQLADAMPGDPNDENARANCVPASLASGLMALLPGQTFYADELKDAAYGEGYTGATDPAHFVAACAAHGVALRQTTGTDSFALLHLAVAALDRHEPATIAIPSQWGSVTGADIAAHGGPTHEVLLCDFDGANLTAMNPWPVDGAHAFYQRMPLDWWASRLCYDRVFTMERTTVPYIHNGDGSLTYPNGVHLTYGIAAYVVANQISATPLFAETYFVPQHSCVPFDTGIVLGWDKALNRVRTDLGATIIDELVQILAHRPVTDSADTLDDAAMHQAIATLQAALADDAPAAPAASVDSSGETSAGEPMSAAPASVTVQFGDTLAQLAAACGVDRQQLAAANGITDPDALRVGQVLSVPAVADEAARGGADGAA